MTRPITRPTFQRCKAHRKNGEQCKLPPIRGGSVCGSHGGRAPQVKATASERMRDLVHPALTSLARQINSDQFAAVKYVLDWAGFRSDTSVTVTVHFDTNNANTLELPDSD